MTQPIPNVQVIGEAGSDAGMLALWDPLPFSHVVDYDSWDVELCEDVDIQRHIRSGTFVPLNIRSDGFWAVLVRVGTTDTPAVLTERELRYRLATSQPYLFRSTGQARLCGIEHVGAEPPEETLRFELPSGPYSAEVTIIAWEDEPGSLLADGGHSAAALPGYVVTLNPLPDDRGGFRTHVETYDPVEE